MAVGKVPTSVLTDIANAIRRQNGTAATTGRERWRRPSLRWTA
nr:MAG TPA: hypothetical protein [Caudoviricetes sp.]